MKNNPALRTYATVKPQAREGGPGSAGQSGDTQGLPDTAEGGSESIKELAEEGQYFEAELQLGVEDALDPDVDEVRTKQLPEEDVPSEYLGEK
jgi:hypothetical protein